MAMMGIHKRIPNKPFTAILGILAVIVVVSLAYIVLSAAIYTPLPNSPSNSNPVERPSLEEAVNPAANLTKPKGENLPPSLMVSRETILSVRVVMKDSGLPLSGVQVYASPLNDTRNLAFPPGGGGPIPASCSRGVPSGAVIREDERVVILPNGTKLPLSQCVWETYVTNSTGWAVIRPPMDAKYYLLTSRYVDPDVRRGPAPPGAGRTFEIVQVNANQTTYVTLMIPPI